MRNERHDNVIQFKTEIENTVDALTEISIWNKQVLASKARILLCTINRSEFLLSLPLRLTSFAITIKCFFKEKQFDALKAQEDIED